MDYLIVNDVHLGVKRTGGTTPASRSALNAYLHEGFRHLVMSHTNKGLIINGDLFDGFQVDAYDLVNAYNTLADWLFESAKPLVLIAGNHDYQPKAGKLSSFEMLCHFLSKQFSGQVQVIDHNSGLTEVGLNTKIWAIPHMPNQDLFDAELEKAKSVTGWLLLHANYDNPFAEQSDHSLNVTVDQARAFDGHLRLMFGHEHQGRHENAGMTMVEVIGNQLPSSVADCMAKGSAQVNGMKRAAVIHPDHGWSEVPTWEAIGSFAQSSWQDLSPVSVPASAQFVRVIGTATAEQAAEVVNAVARFRSSSNAFVVTNAVRIEGVEGLGELSEMTFETIKNFDVLSALLEVLDDNEAKAVKELMNAETA